MALADRPPRLEAVYFPTHEPERWTQLARVLEASARAHCQDWAISVRCLTPATPRTARAVQLLPHVLVRYPRELVPDASTTTYRRKEPQDRMVRQIRRARDREPGWRPLRGTFPWTRVI